MSMPKGEGALPDSRKGPTAVSVTTRRDALRMFGAAATVVAAGGVLGACARAARPVVVHGQTTVIWTPISGLWQLPDKTAIELISEAMQPFLQEHPGLRLVSAGATSSQSGGVLPALLAGTGF